MWQYTPIIRALGRLRQEDAKFWDSLTWTMRPYVEQVGEEETEGRRWRRRERREEEETGGRKKHFTTGRAPLAGCIHTDPGSRDLSSRSRR